MAKSTKNECRPSGFAVTDGDGAANAPKGPLDLPIPLIDPRPTAGAVHRAGMLGKAGRLSWGRLGAPGPAGVKHGSHGPDGGCALELPGRLALAVLHHLEGIALLVGDVPARYHHALVRRDDDVRVARLPPGVLHLAEGEH